MIIYILLTISLVEVTSLMNDGTQHLERLTGELQKTMRYQHHRQNYEKSMRTGIVPKDLPKKHRYLNLPVKIFTSSGTKFYTIPKKTPSSFHCMNRRGETRSRFK